MPHQTRDPVPVACEIVGAIQALVTRRYEASEAMVVTVTQLDAGSAHNVIPDRATLKGTIRTLSPERRHDVRGALRRLAEHIAEAHECRAEVTVVDGFPPTLNDPRAVALMEAVAGALPGGGFERLAHPIMGAEDFSYVLEKVPGAMAFLGVAAEDADWAHCPGIHLEQDGGRRDRAAARRRDPRRQRAALPRAGVGVKRSAAASVDIPALG